MRGVMLSAANWADFSPLWLAALAAILMGIVGKLSRWAKNLPLTEQYLVLVLPFALAIALGVVLERAESSEDFNWNSVRLSPAFAIWHGQPIYPGAHEGVVSGHIYGPVSALAYLPAVLFASPEAAIRAGSLIAPTFFFLPALALFVVCAGRGRRELLWAGAGWMLFFLLVVRSDALSYNAFMIHAEAPALGFAVASCAALLTSAENVKRLPIAALFAVLAVWSKQTLLPVLVALPIYLWFSQGFAVALRFCGWLTFIMVIAGAGFSFWFGAHELWYNQIVIPSKHPWLGSISDTSLPWIYERDYGARLGVLFEALQGLARRWAKALLVMGGIVLCRHLYPNNPPEAKARWTRRFADWLRQPGGLCSWVALWLVPTSLLGRVKAGGDNNAYGPATCFMCLSAAVWLMLSLKEYCSGKPPHPLRFKWVVWPAVVCASIMSAWFVTATAANLTMDRRSTTNGAVAYAREHPGRIYFPWNPLLTLMAEGRTYHFAYGVYDRALAGLPITPEHFQSGLPMDIQEVIYAEGDDRTLLAAYLTNYTTEARLPELPGWVILRRND